MKYLIIMCVFFISKTGFGQGNEWNEAKTVIINYPKFDVHKLAFYNYVETPIRVPMNHITLICKPVFDSETVINSFTALATNNRYAYFLKIKNAIIANDFTSASALVALPLPPLVGVGLFLDTITGVQKSNDSNSDYIATNYRMFYSTYINYVNGSMACSDSNNVVYMANLCPSIYGTVVYQSRSLYTAVFNKLQVWNDDNCLITPDTANACQCGRNGRKAKNATNSIYHEDGERRYQLVPNPNNGQFVIQQSVADTQPITAEIWNNLGQCIYKQPITFADKTYSIDMGNINQGVYLMKLIDSKGRVFTNKFFIR